MPSGCLDSETPLGDLVPSLPSPLRDPGHAQALSNALAPGEVGWVIALWVEAISTYREGRIERKSSLGGGPRLFPRAEQRQRCAEREMTKGNSRYTVQHILSLLSVFCCLGF